MEIFFKLKQWVIESTWKPWVIGGAVIIVLATFYRETQIEKMATIQLKEIVSIIQGAERNMQETKKLVQVKDKEIDNEFDKSFKKNEEHREASENSIHEVQKAISDMVNKRMEVNKPVKEPLISEKRPHTIDDVKVVRLALEGTLNKLITLRTEDILEEYIELQKQFENLLIEVFAEKAEDVKGKKS